MGARDRAVIVALMVASGVVGGLVGARYASDPSALASSGAQERARKALEGAENAEESLKKEYARLDALDWSDPAVRLENPHAGVYRQGRLAAKLYREGKLSREKAEQVAERLELLATIRGAGIDAGSR